MPQVAYEWSNKDIFATEASDDQNLSMLSNFFRKADIPNLREGNIKKLYNAGYQTVGSMVRLTASDIVKIPGMGMKTAEVLANSLALVKEIPCQKLMDASNAFGRGFGEKRLTLLLEAFPNALTSPPSLDELLNVDSIGDVIAQEFIEGLKSFKRWQQTEGISCGAPPPPKKNQKTIDMPPNSKLAGQVLLFSGYRPTEELKSKLETLGASIEENVNKKVTLVITKIKGASTTKTEKADKMNIMVISHNELMEMIGVN
jgi:NAD-dependent DNA ligase